MGLAARAIRAAGVAAAWCYLFVAVVCFAVVALRYGASVGWVAMQELFLWAHAAAMMLALPLALLEDEHVRVDVLYRRWPARGQRRLNLAGTVLLLFPVCGFLVWSSLDFVAAAWRVMETSPEAGGLPGLFAIKTVIPVAAILLLLAGVLAARGSTTARDRPAP